MPQRDDHGLVGLPYPGRGQMHAVSGNLATMAGGRPYAIAAQIAHLERQVIAFVGDGELV